MRRFESYRGHTEHTCGTCDLTSGGGFRGAYLLRREHARGAEFVTLTLFSSVNDVRAFSGDDLHKPNVSPAARSTLDETDPTVRHFEVVSTPVSGGRADPGL